MQVSNIKVSQNGRTVFRMDDMLEIGVNETLGGYEYSTAVFSVPIKEGASGTITTTNDAIIKNDSEYYYVKLKDNKKEIRVKSENLFATIKIEKQKCPVEFDFFGIYFGVSGVKEVINEKGGKNRPHIAFYPDGNGKFFRKSDYNCDIECNMIYENDSKLIFPNTVFVKVMDYKEQLRVDFEFDKVNHIATLLEASFITIE